MTNAIVEYMGTIEVIKAFSQGERSYEKYESAVNDNAFGFVDGTAFRFPVLFIGKSDSSNVVDLDSL